MVKILKISILIDMKFFRIINNTIKVKVAEAIVKLFPVAAVVLPIASRISVFFLTSGSNSLISAIPPALSAIAPKASIDSWNIVVDSNPIPHKAIPKNPHRE